MTDSAMNSDKALLGSKEVCKALDIDRSTLTRRIKRGLEPLPVGRVGTGFVFDRSSVEKILTQVGSADGAE